MRHDDTQIQKITVVFETIHTFVIVQRCPIVKIQKRHVRFVLNIRYRYKRLFMKSDNYNKCNRDYRMVSSRKTP